MNVIELPGAAKPEPTLDPEVLARIVTLHNYANSQRGFITESWASREFKRTFELVYAMCKDEVPSSSGFAISYSPNRADHIHASYDSGYSASNRFHRNLPLNGELAQVFEEELHALAMVRAVADQKRDEDELLRQRAQQRLNLVLAHGIRRPERAGDND